MNEVALLVLHRHCLNHQLRLHVEGVTRRLPRNRIGASHLRAGARSREKKNEGNRISAGSP